MVSKTYLSQRRNALPAPGTTSGAGGVWQTASLTNRKARHMTRATDVVAYTFQADTYCQGCIVDQLPTGDGEAFDGWNLASGATMSTEENLSEVAAAFGIDRMDEHSFDSGDFPKVVFSSQVESAEHCGACGELID